MEYLPLIAASAQRQIGATIAAVVLLAMAVYWFFNWLEGRHESGSEIELAANRMPPVPDEHLETKRLDLALTGALGLLTVVALTLPLYWLGEPGRHQGLVDFTDDQFIKQGAEIFDEQCSSCHGSAGGEGGFAADYSLVDGNGIFVEQVQWQAPSLATVLNRFSYDEVKYILTYGRPNSPMPAWGVEGGGPLTDQQLDKIIAYLASEQLDPEETQASVLAGLDQAALDKAESDNYDEYTTQLDLQAEIAEAEHDLEKLAEDDPARAAIQAEIDKTQAALDEITASLKAKGEAIRAAADGDQLLMGELLFNNPAGAGAFGCARCHSAGWSYDANAYPHNPLLPKVVDGGGGFGPSLYGVADQFETAKAQQDFVASGTTNAEAYGSYGQGDGGGQMPAFGHCSGDEVPTGYPRIQTERISGHCDMINPEDPEGDPIDVPGMLTEEQIEAIVAYERSLGE